MMRFYLGLIVILLPFRASADWIADKFIDPQEGYLDTSDWLATRTGFLPVPIIITEPAVGYGGGLALAFFHGQFTGREVRPGGSGKTRWESDPIYASGVGFRYLIASSLGLQMGMDIARGPEDTAIYFQVGSSWLR